MFRLEVEPALRSDVEVSAQPERCIGGDGALAPDDGADAARRNGNLTGQPVDADGERFHELLPQDLTGMDGFQQSGILGHWAPQ